MKYNIKMSVFENEYIKSLNKIAAALEKQNAGKCSDIKLDFGNKELLVSSLTNQRAIENGEKSIDEVKQEYGLDPIGSNEKLILLDEFNNKTFLKIIDGKVFLNDFRIKGVHTYNINHTCVDGRLKTELTLQLYIDSKITINGD